MAFSSPDDPSSKFPQSVQKTRDPMADMVVLDRNEWEGDTVFGLFLSSRLRVGRAKRSRFVVSCKGRSMQLNLLAGLKGGILLLC